jgi:orotidine-5'-phosphate decarboxylase
VITPRLGTTDRLRQRAVVTGHWLCLGLDPDLDRLPVGFPRSRRGVVDFCRSIIAATADIVTAYKINFAFFEALGPDGWRALQEVRSSIPAEIPVIADAKRGDIANTARGYAHAILDVFGFDAVTLSPYLGWDSLQPFAAYEGKCLFVLCKTSNPGAADFQDRLVDNEPLYMHVARRAAADHSPAAVGLVVGATQPEAIRAVRSLSEDLLLLLPGVGAQGADAAIALNLGANRAGQNAIISVSREILFVSAGTDFAEATRDRTLRLSLSLVPQPGGGAN